MSFEMTREQFLIKAGYTDEDWQKSALDWNELVTIAKHHDAARKTLVLHGGTIANRIQEFDGVHSVRWRVKDTFGLLKKILRKNLEASCKEKWKTVTAHNYRSVVSDLVGIRALHLLKDDCTRIDEQIREIWDVYDITVFKREGDAQLTEIINRGAKEELHIDGYRSIHYAHNYLAEKDPILVEIQVRTVFQEGWSEIDHKVKYPDFSNNETLKYFLSVFNGLAGTADDMGSFVIQLNDLIDKTTATISEGEVALAAKDSDIEKLQLEIDKLRTDGKTSSSAIDSLQTSVDNIKEKNISQTKNALLSRAMLDIYVPKSLSIKAEPFKLITEKLSPSSEMMKAIDNMCRSSTVVAEALEAINRPNAEIAKALEAATRPSAEIAKALEAATRPSAEIAKALEAATRPSAEIAKALEAATRPSAEIAKALEEATRPIAAIAKALEAATRPNAEIAKAFKAVNRPNAEISTALKVSDQRVAKTDKPLESSSHPADNTLQTNESLERVKSTQPANATESSNLDALSKKPK